MAMTIIADSREQRWDHVKSYFDSQSIRWIRSKLPVGDYARMDNMTTVIDRKAGLGEVEGNLIHQHERFRRELQLAQDNGIRLIVLIEQAGVESVHDVAGWVNPRRVRWEKIDRAHSKGRMLNVKISPQPPVDGPQLAKIMQTMADKYAVEWRFTTHNEVGAEIMRILSELD